MRFVMNMNLEKKRILQERSLLSQIEEICSVLEQFQQRMKEYDVTEFHCYATSAIRNAKNTGICSESD